MRRTGVCVILWRSVIRVLRKNVIIQEYAQLVGGARVVLNDEEFGNNNQVEQITEQKAKIILQEMYGKDFSEYVFRDACIKEDMQLQNASKDRSYERGARIQ